MPEQELKRFHPKSRAEWRAWLERHHESSPGVWLVSFKQHTGKARVSYAEAVEEALCFGWVDSRPNALDGERFMQLFSPRKAGSPWSRINKQRVERLTAQGLMTPAGQAKVDQAKRDGSWGRYDQVEALEVPSDLAAGFEKNAEARRYFEAFSPSSKKIILWWIAGAKRPETRARRIRETVQLAAKNLKANHYRQ